MKTAAVICEYNPFHFGHQKQLGKMRELVGSDGILLSIMSGDFVQRGGPALYDKRKRAVAAVSCGSDLVIELPFPFSGAVAERFAMAGVAIAAGLSVDYLVFGSESGEENREIFRQAARFPFVKNTSSMHTSTSHIHRQEAAFENQYGQHFPSGKNDRLAVEYFRAARYFGIESKLKILNRTEDGLSAHLARKFLTEQNWGASKSLLPEPMFEVVTEQIPIGMEDLFSLVFPILLRETPSSLSNLFDISKEIAARFIKTARECDHSSYKDFLVKVKNKNDSTARLRRSLVTALLRVEKTDLFSMPCFGFVLAANSKGKAYLSQRRRQVTKFPLLTRLSDAKQLGDEAISQMELMLRAESFYRLMQKRYVGRGNILSEHTQFLP